MTERKRYEVELEEAKDQALAANKLKSQFVATVSHELRTPLTSLVGLSELLLAGGITQDELQSTALTMFDSAKSLLSVLNDLLDFAKLEAGKSSIEHIPYSLKKVVQDVIELLRHKSDRKGLTLTYIIAPDLPDLLIGDPLRVRQVLTNLLDNAIKFTECGAIEVIAELKQDHAFIAVTDTGIGIAATKQESLFLPFSQLHAQNPKYSGTGLGLSIVDQFVRLMGGEIGVTSKEGLGATFWFALPLNHTENRSDD